MKFWSKIIAFKINKKHIYYNLMDNIFIIAACISVVFLIAKIIVTKFVEKKDKPLNLLIKDVLFVYLSSVCGFYVFTVFFKGIKEGQITPVFTDNPGF